MAQRDAVSTVDSCGALRMPANDSPGDETWPTQPRAVSPHVESPAIRSESAPRHLCRGTRRFVHAYCAS